MKTRQDNDVTDHTSAVHVEIRIELSWLIGQNAFYHENQIGERHDRSDSVRSMTKTKLNYHD